MVVLAPWLAGIACWTPVGAPARHVRGAGGVGGHRRRRGRGVGHLSLDILEPPSRSPTDLVGERLMATAVELRGDVDRTDVPHIVRTSVQLGLAGVRLRILMSLASRFLSGPVETILLAGAAGGRDSRS